MAKKQRRRRAVEKEKASLNKPRRIKLYSLIAAGATLLGYVALIPRPLATIDANPPDPNNPFSSPINISNTGFLPLHNVDISIGILEISGNGKVPTVNIHGQPGYKSRVHPMSWVPREMWPDDHFTLAFDQFSDFPSTTFGEASLAVVIGYEFPIIHIHRAKIFPYYTKKLSNGGFAWYADAPHTESDSDSSN